MDKAIPTIKCEDATVLVTGANRGFGRALAKAFLARGARRVYAACRQPTVALPDEKRMQWLVMDVTDSDAVAAASVAVPELDILVNNAGVLLPGGVTGEHSEQALRAMLEVHLFGVLAVTRAFLPHLRSASQGCVVNIASTSALCSVPAAGAYSVSKACLHSATQSMRSELREDGIRVLGVYPGPTGTDMTAGSPLELADVSASADSILNSIEAGITDIYPDTAAELVRDVLGDGPRLLEQQFSGMQLQD
jgi:NAD(P)-dependent dehydrogenase (short-subunit alcohol dehydrogenase family)